MSRWWYGLWVKQCWCYKSKGYERNFPATLCWAVYLPPFPPYPAVESLPKPSSINFVSETSNDTSSRPRPTESLRPGGNQAVTDTQEILQSNHPPPLTIGEGLPPVPGKLVNRIQSSHFIDLAELLPDRLGVVIAYEEETAKHYSRKYKTVTDILEWVQCFGIYTAIIS